MRRLLTAFVLCAAAGLLVAGQAHAAVTAIDINPIGYTNDTSFVKYNGTLTCTAGQTWEMSGQAFQGGHTATATVGERRSCTGGSQEWGVTARIGAKAGTFTTGPADVCVKVVNRTATSVKGGGTATVYNYCETITLEHPPA